MIGPSLNDPPPLMIGGPPFELSLANDRGPPLMTLPTNDRGPPLTSPH